MLPVFLREIDKEAVQRNKPRIAIVYSVENWDVVERLVNELRYEFRDTYHISALNVKTSQSQSIHEVPHHIRRHYSRCQVVYAIGVVYKSSPHFEPRLMDSLSRRLGALDNLPRLFVPVIDCILVRESKEQIEEDMQKCRFAEEWAKRGVDAFNMLMPC
ncbi:hypothetical protein GGH91_000968 [Coemansia sp. RSA 2671]|nr:hypothetical protein GGH91_000968 [Coemansia sp. RSA 2671]